MTDIAKYRSDDPNREMNPDKKGNMRDDANLNQLLELSNMESYNAVLIDQGKLQSERLVLLRDLAVKQMKTMESLTMTGLAMLTKKEDK